MEGSHLQQTWGELVSTVGGFGAPAVPVVWEDAAHQFGWLEGEEVEQHDGTVETVGWLLEENSKHLVVAQSLTEGTRPDPSGPSGMVRRIVRRAC